MTHRQRGRAIAVLALILKQKNSARLRGLLVHIGEAMGAVAREQIQGNERIAPKLLLPASAGGRKARLRETPCGQDEPAQHRAWRNHVGGGIVERVDLLLIESLSNERKVKGHVVNAPAQREFRAIIAEWQNVARDARFGHGASGEAVPVRAQSGLKDEVPAEGPGILRVGARLGVGKS